MNPRELAVFARLVARLRSEESFRGQPYDDATAQKLVAPEGNVTLGYGRNTDAKPLSREEGEYLLSRDAVDAILQAHAVYPDLDELPIQWQIVLTDMAYSMGERGLRSFRRLREAISARDRLWAAAEIVDSRYWRTHHNRASRNRQLILDGMA